MLTLSRDGAVRNRFWVVDSGAQGFQPRPTVCRFGSRNLKLKSLRAGRKKGCREALIASSCELHDV